MLTLVFAAVLLAGCGLAPEEMPELAARVSSVTEGEVMAHKMGSMIIVIDVASSPLYHAPAGELQAAVDAIAADLPGYVEELPTSMAITLHKAESSEDMENVKQFIFAEMDGRMIAVEE